MNEYIVWLRQSGFAPSTIYIQERLLGHFERYVQERNLEIREFFTYATLLDFEKQRRLWYASWSLQSLARYLARTGAIASAIEKPVPGLPDIYEEYLKFFKENGQVTSSTRGARQVSRLRKIYDAAEHSIGLPVDDAAQYEATMLVERFKSVDEQLASVMDQVKTVCKRLPA